MTSPLPRAMPAIVTPFGRDGSLDLGGHADNIELVRRRGGTGVVLAGSTGEGPYLEPGERERLIKATRDADPDITIICGVFAESVRSALTGIQSIMVAGATVALVTTPTTLVRGQDAGVERFYEAVADDAELPILLYTVPKVTGYELPVESIRGLAAHPSIVGMKDSGGNADRISELSDVLGEDFVVFAGASRAIASSAHNGAWGAITASSNYALALVSLAVRGDVGAQQRLSALTAAIEVHGVPGTKYAASLTGMRTGPPRLPLVGPHDAARREIAGALEEHGLVSAQAR